MAAIVTLTVSPSLDVSLSVDTLTPDQKLRADRPRLEPGGGGLNVARAVRQLGGNASALWTCGGTDGRRLAGLLDAEGVEHEPIEIKDETRRNTHIEERSSGRLYRVLTPGATVSEAEGTVLLDRIASLRGVEFLVLSGSLAPGLATDFYARAAGAAPTGVKVVLDTSGEALDRGLRGGIFLAKPNRRELCDLVACNLHHLAELAEAGYRLIQEGRVEVLTISLGSEGVIVVTRDGDERIPAPDVEPVSRVGAGDSMVAGIVLALSRRLPLDEAVRFGVAAGAAATLTPGTQLCRREDAERLYVPLAAPVH